MKWFNLTYGDYLAIQQESKLAIHISPLIARDDIRAVSDYTSTNGQVSGVPPVYSRVRTIPLAVGRWINDEDNDQHRRVCVLGREMTRNMFPGRPAVGNSILLNGVRFEVIGVLSMIGHEEHNATNIRIFVPFNTMREPPKTSCTGSWPATTAALIPRARTSGRSGTRSRTRRPWAPSSPPWIGFWVGLGW
jgi:putative ABC transport system permease protein